MIVFSNNLFKLFQELHQVAWNQSFGRSLKFCKMLSSCVRLCLRQLRGYHKQNWTHPLFISQRYYFYGIYFLPFIWLREKIKWSLNCNSPVLFHQVIFLFTIYFNICIWQRLIYMRNAEELIIRIVTTGTCQTWHNTCKSVSGFQRRIRIDGNRNQVQKTFIRKRKQTGRVFPKVY